MNIKTTVKAIFISIASRLGLELQQKTDTQINYSDDGLNPTAIGAGVIANIAIDDSDIIIEGDNTRAEAIREMADYFMDEIQYAAAEISLGTGDCLVRPFTDGKNIGLNLIGNDNFVITENIGTHLKGVIIKLDEYETDKATFRLFESQTLKERSDKTVLYIKRFAYKDNNEVALNVTAWQGLAGEETITSDQLLIGRYKCPTINRDDYNSANGVPITFGCESIIENVKAKYRQYNEEFDRKQALIFADRTMFKTDQGTNGSSKITLDGHQFINVKTGVDSNVSNMIQDYSPSIRESNFQNGNNFNFSILELCCGFSRGVFTSPETAFATATEMKNSLKKTFSFVKRFRKRIESGNKMLFNAINIIMNINGTTPIGDWNIRHDWSYDYIEQTNEKFNQLIQAHSAGAIKTEDVTSWVLGIDEQEAKNYVEELKAETESENAEDNFTSNNGIMFK